MSFQLHHCSLLRDLYKHQNPKRFRIVKNLIRTATQIKYLRLKTMKKEILERLKTAGIVVLLISTIYFYSLYSGKAGEFEALRSEYNSLYSEKEKTLR